MPGAGDRERACGLDDVHKRCAIGGLLARGVGAVVITLGDKGALKVYGTGQKAGFDLNRV